MRRLILKMSMSVDGFVGGPNGEMNWMFRSMSPDAAAWSVASLEEAGIHAMGRKTFRDMAAYWPTSTDVFAPVMNRVPKIVFTHAGLAGATGATTRALDDARAQGAVHKAADPDVLRGWTDPRVATGDLATEIARLRQEPGKEIVAHGGSAFAQSLVKLDLVDEYRLMVHPIVIGRGLPLFASAAAPLELELVEIVSFSKGAAAHVYKRR